MGSVLKIVAVFLIVISTFLFLKGAYSDIEKLLRPGRFHLELYQMLKTLMRYGESLAVACVLFYLQDVVFKLKHIHKSRTE